MSGKRTYCILGTMLLAFASLGAGVSAEQNNEQVTDLEDLGILELRISDDGVVEALVTKDTFLSFMNSDEAALMAIESVAMSVSIGEHGELLLSDFEIGVGENQSDEITVTLRLSEELVDILHDEDVNLEDLLNEVGFGDDLGLDDFTPEVEDDYYGSRIHWADEAYQLRGCQDDYDRVMDAEDPADEYYAIYDEMIQDWEENESVEDENETEEDWNEEDSSDEEEPEVEDDSGDELDEESHEEPGEENDRDDRDRLDDALDMREDEITQIVVIVNTDGTIADVTVIVIYDDGAYDMFVFTMLLEDLRGRLANFEGIVVWNWIPSPPDVEERCRSGTIRGTFTVDDEGNGTLRGQVYNEAGELVTNMWGGFNTDGFVRGLAGDNISMPIAQWKAVYEDERFNGLWKMTNVTDDTHGILKGIYELNDNRTGGVFHGKWKAVDCHDYIGAGNDSSWATPDRDHVEPRHNPIQVDAERVDDARLLDKSPKEKPLMDKLGDVMDKPIVEDSEGGAIVDIGDAAVGSTLGTIALLGAGFIRRRITGGI